MNSWLFIRKLAARFGRVACECRRIYSCHFSYFSGGEKRPPEINLCSQVRLGAVFIIFHFLSCDMSSVWNFCSLLSDIISKGN